MDSLYAVSVNHFVSREDSSPTTYCFYSLSIKRTCIFILYVQLQLISVVATHAASLPQELYWKSMLPTTTPMPKSIADLLHKPEFNTSPRRSGFGNRYGHGHFETKLQDDPNSTDLFFLEKDLKFGRTISFIFTQSSNEASLLPREVVKSIPFSSSKISEILNKFDVNPGSIKAEVMENTINVCEEPEIKGEDKYCATSLESMLDFITSKLGKNVEVFSTEMKKRKKKKKETRKKEYRIIRVKKVGETNLVVCHKLSYVYAVFYCHKMEKTVAYMISLEGDDGSKVKAVSVCHRDTSAWYPKHLAFQMLKVKPGSDPICHFLLQDAVVWLPKR